MSNIQIIKAIEKKLGLPLKLVTSEEVKKITKIPPAYAIDENGHITGLWLAHVQYDVTPEIAKLLHLTTLYLFNGLIKEIGFLKELKSLNSLDLRYTKITDISVVTDLPFLSIIFLDNIETLVNPPKHIIDKGMAAIRNYFAQQNEQGVDRLYEAKVLIVGDPGSGKTSLRKKLIDPKYNIPNKEVSTLGAEVQKNWTFPYCNKPDIKFQASIWDSGGQDIQYMIHQYFLTGKCLYERKQNTHICTRSGNPKLFALNELNRLVCFGYMETPCTELINIHSLVIGMVLMMLK